jgi:S-adenosylmethionine decarboxylase proenzyme
VKQNIGMPEHAFQGVHIFGECYGIRADLLNDMEKLSLWLSMGIERSGATLCSMQQKQFSPSGVTLLALLSESHASIHTYPDEGAFFFDAFTCGPICRPQEIAHFLIEQLQPTSHHLQTVHRGQFSSSTWMGSAPLIQADPAHYPATTLS